MSIFLEADYFLFHMINQVWTNSWFDLFFPWVTDLHKTLLFQCTVVPFVGLAFYLKYKKKGILLFVMTLLCLATSDLVGNQIKHGVQRPRPGDNIEIQPVLRSPYGSYSFISNHASNIFAFALFFSSFFLLARWPLFLIALVISYSRVYNGVHYPSDVLAGAIHGLSWGFVFVQLARKILRIQFFESREST